MKLKQWIILKRDLLLDLSPWLKVFKEKVRLPNGRIVDDYYTIDRPDYVEIVAMNRKKEIVGLWQYKHGIRRVHLNLPAGYIQNGESPLVAAKRELKEEVALVSKEWNKLGEFFIEGNRSASKVHLFVAYNCIKCKPVHSDDLEEQKIEWLTLEKWIMHIRKGDVPVIGSAIAIFMIALEYTITQTRRL